MSYKIKTSVEQRRGCGFRKEGGLYFVSGSAMAPCQNLPVQLSVCPVCHHGIHPSRGFTWLDIDPIIQDKVTKEGRRCYENYCETCPANGHHGSRIGLIWIGEKYYPTTSHYITEAGQMGFSRRISQVPREFKLGEDVIALAHRKAIWSNGLPESERGKHGQFSPGIFLIFKPERIEYIVHNDGSDDPVKLERLVKRGITLIKVKKMDDDFLNLNTQD